MKLWKTILLQAGIFTSVFALGAGGGFLVAYQKTAEKEKTDEMVAQTPSSNPETPHVETRAEKFLNNLVSSKAIEGDINLKIARVQEEEAPLPSRALDLDDLGEIDLSISDVKVSFADLEDIKLSADINVKTGNLDMDLTLGYFDGTAFLDYDDTHFYLKTTDLVDIALMFPNFSFDLVNQFLDSQTESSFNLDLNALTESLKNIEEFEENDQNYFLFDFTEDIQIKFVTNDLCEMVGVELPELTLGEFTISATSSLHTLSNDIEDLVSPLEREGAPKYSSFKPAFTLASHVVNLINTKKANITLDVDVDKNVTEDEVTSKEDFIDIDGTIDLDASDLSSIKLNASLGIDENNRHHSVKASYLDSTIYATYGNFYTDDSDLNVSITNQSVESLIEFITNKIGDEESNNVLDELGNFSLEFDLPKILQIINDVPEFIDNFALTSRRLEFSFDSSYFELPLGKFDILINFDNESIKSISLKNVTYEDYSIDISLTLGKYIDFTIDPSKYVRLDPAVTLMDDFDKLIQQNEFGVNFEISIQDGEDATSLNGVFDFTLKEKEGQDENVLIKERTFDTGAGNLTIVDKDNIHHRINAYAKSSGEVLLDYDMRELDNNGNEIIDNQKMYAKFNYKTIDSIVETLGRLTSSSSSNASSMIGYFMGSDSASMPIKEIIDGNYGLLLETKILNSLEITDNKITAGVNGALFNMDTMNFVLVIHFSDGVIEGMEIQNLNLGDSIINITANLQDFNENSYNTHAQLLPDNKDYLDISSVATLLEIGINTTEFNYFKISGTIDISMVMNLFGYDVNLKNISVPVTIEILNDDNHVKVLAKFEVPKINQFIVVGNYALNTAPTSYVMFDSEESLFYIARHDSQEAGYYLFSPSSSSKVTRIKCDMDYIFDNIFDVFLNDIFGMGDFVMDLVSDVGSVEDERQMAYDNLISNYSYNAGKYSLDLNLAELAGNDKMGTLGITVTEGSYQKVNEDESVETIKIMQQIGASFDMNLALNFYMYGNATFTLVNKDFEIEGHELTYMDNWISSHSGDVLNQKYTN